MFGTQEMLGMMAVISFQGPASPLGTQPAGTFQATGSLFLAPPLAATWVIFCSTSQMLPCTVLVAEGNFSAAYKQATHTRKTDCCQFSPSKITDHSGDAGLRFWLARSRGELVISEQRSVPHATNCWSLGLPEQVSELVCYSGLFSLQMTDFQPKSLK